MAPLFIGFAVRYRVCSEQGISQVPLTSYSYCRPWAARKRRVPANAPIFDLAARCDTMGRIPMAWRCARGTASDVPDIWNPTARRAV